MNQDFRGLFRVQPYGSWDQREFDLRLRADLLFFDVIEIVGADYQIKYLNFGRDWFKMAAAGHCRIDSLDTDIPPGTDPQVEADMVGMHKMSWQETGAPGKWTMADYNSELADHQDLPRARGVKIELLRELPVPTIDVPMDRVLTFKQQRRAELDAFHCYLNELALYIADASDQTMAAENVAQKLQSACRDLRKASISDRIKATLSTAVFEFNCAGPIATALAAFGINGVAGSIVGATTISLYAILPAKHLPKRSTPVSYLCRIHDELLWDS